MSGRPEPPTSSLGRWRDGAVWWVANGVLRCGSPWLQTLIEGSIKYGLRAAVEDADRDLMTDADELRLRSGQDESGGVG